MRGTMLEGSLSNQLISTANTSEVTMSTDSLNTRSGLVLNQEEVDVYDENQNEKFVMETINSKALSMETVRGRVQRAENNKAVIKVQKVPRYKKRNAQIIQKYKSLRVKDIINSTKLQYLLPQNIRLRKKLIKCNQKLELERIRATKLCIFIYNACREIDGLTANNQILKNSISKIISSNSNLAKDLKHHKNLVDNFLNKLKEMKPILNKYKIALQNANVDRQTLRWELQNIRSNVSVFCRIHQGSDANNFAPLHRVIRIKRNTLELHKEYFYWGRDMGKLHYSFDQIFSHSTRDKEIFCSVSPLIQAALDGSNVLLLLYGQIGSGKTYTLEGDPSQSIGGILLSTAEMIFEYIIFMKSSGWSFVVSLCCVEILDDVVNDLLGATDANDQQESYNTQTNCDFAEARTMKFQEATVSNINELIKVVQTARKKYISSKMDRKNCLKPSHFIKTIKLTGTNRRTNKNIKGSINLIELAWTPQLPAYLPDGGSNSKHNRTLIDLEQLILTVQEGKRLSQKKKKSQLICLLTPYLDTTSKIGLFVHVNLLDINFTETIASLEFAQNVFHSKSDKARHKEVKTTKANFYLCLMLFVVFIQCFYFMHMLFI